MKINKVFYITFILFLAFAYSAKSQSGFIKNLKLKGQLSAWLSPDPANSFQTFTGIRYIPELSVKKNLSKKVTIDAEISLNAFGSAFIHSFDNTNFDGRIKPYRMWCVFQQSNLNFVQVCKR